MTWFRVCLSEEEQRIVGEERREHPHEPTRRKMETLWLLHHGLTREKVAKIVGVGVSTVKRYANAFRDGGLDGLRRWEKKGRTGPLETHRELLADRYGNNRLPRGRGGRPHRAIDRDPSWPIANAASFEEARIALAADGCYSSPPKKSIEEHVAEQQRFLADEPRPRLDAAEAGKGHVFFVDAAHFVFGTFLCCLWSFGRLFVRVASGRQRFNVLGHWNAVTRELIAVTNTTVVNTETMCELLHEARPADWRDRSRLCWTTPVISETRGTGSGRATRDYIAIPAFVLPQPESD